MTILQTVGIPLGTALVNSSGPGLAPHPHAAHLYWPIRGWRAAVKRAIDIAVAAVALVLLAIPLLLTAGLIRLESRGSPWFRQRRIGFANAPFVLWKLRT